MAEVFDFGLQQHKIKMDGKFFENSLFAVAGDTGRRLEVQLLNSEGVVQNTTGISLRLNGDVAGQVTYTEAVLVDATKGLYELDLPNGMLMAPGDWQFQWQIIGANGDKLHSFAFLGSIGINLSEGGTEGVNFYLNTEELRLKTIELENKYQTMINEFTNKDIASAPEIIEARADLDSTVYPSLKLRNDAFEAKTKLYQQTNDLKLSSYEVIFSGIDESLKKIADDVKDYGAVGDGVSNDTLAVKAFLSKGGNLVVSEGTYMIEADFYPIASNTHLKFLNGSKFKLLPHDASSYSMLQTKDVDNVTVINAWLDGSKSENSSLTGEWGHGIDILNSDNIVFERPAVVNTWGDGIYLGHSFWGPSTKETDTVSIIQPTIDGARRNGISVCGGRNLLIDAPTIKNVRGTSPMAAIDIEPEGMGGVAPFLENLVIRNATAINCGTGLEILLDNLKDRNLTTDITVDGLKTIECDTPITLRKLTGKLDGSVSINKVQSINSKNGVVFMSGYHAVNTPHITINGIEVDRFNSVKSANDYYNHFLTFLALPEDPAIADIGNLTILNPEIKENENSIFRFIFAQLAGTKKIKNVAIINPKITTTKEVNNFIRGNPDIKIVDGMNTLKLSGAYYQYFIDQNLATEIDNRQALQLVTHYSNDSNTIIGHKIKFRVMNDQPLLFKPSTFIGGFTGAGKGLHSNRIGDVLEVTFVGDRWMVDNMVGTWTVES